MPRLSLKSSATFLAIKRCEGTKIGKVIKQSRSSIYKLAHICATSGKAVNSLTPASFLASSQYTHDPPQCQQGWQLNSYKGSGGNKKLPPRRFPTVGIVRLIRQTTTQLPPQTSSPWCSVCPPNGVNSMNRPNPMHGRPSAGVDQGLLGGVLYKSIK
jgi:hypothetical protein